MQDRRRLLATAAIHETFLRFAREGPARGAWVGAYVLMPDHLHVFVATDDEKITLSDWMKSLTPHRQKTFFDHVLRSDESYSEKWNYVRENPVRARLARNAVDCPFMGGIFSLEYRSG